MSHAPKSRPDVSFSEACSLVETILSGDSRQRILETVAVDGAFGLALSRLRERMRTHVWQVGHGRFGSGGSSPSTINARAKAGFTCCTIGTAKPTASTKTSSLWTSCISSA